VQSLKSLPFSIDINKNYSKGSHTIAVKAVDVNGNSADTSATVNFDIGGGLQMPSSN
jgi:hypothetical protein